jgi:hypothetical protein
MEKIYPNEVIQKSNEIINFLVEKEGIFKNGKYKRSILFRKISDVLTEKFLMCEDLKITNEEINKCLCSCYILTHISNSEKIM